MDNKTAKNRVETILKKNCPPRVKLDGKEDCYSCYINNDDGTKYLLVESIENDNLFCKEWSKENSRYTTEKLINIDETSYKNYQITHSYKGMIFIYNSLEGFTKLNLLRKKLKTHTNAIYRSFMQHLFNKRALLVEERIVVLKTLVDMHLKGLSEQHMAKTMLPIDYLNNKNSSYFIRHPDFQHASTRVRLIMESLVDSNDLLKKESGYIVSSKALKTLADYDEEERRHKNIIRGQFLISLLTLVIAGGTIAQAFINYYK
ncbi:hypothetical protein [Vreelandella sp. EE22]